MIDEEWAPLRAAVPSLAAEWADLVARPGFHPADYENIIAFEMHLDELLDSEGVDALAPLAAALEPLYERVARKLPDAKTADTLEGILTINVHEHLAHALEERGLDLRGWARHFAGPLTLEGWRRALTWTHPECSWDEIEGLLRDEPLAPARGSFRVSAVRPAPEGPSLEMRGQLTGEARQGWFIRMRLSSGHHSAVEITAVRQDERDNDALTLVVSYPFDDIEDGVRFWEPVDDVEIHDVVESRQGLFSTMFPEGSSGSEGPR